MKHTQCKYFHEKFGFPKTTCYPLKQPVTLLPGLRDKRSLTPQYYRDLEIYNIQLEKSTINLLKILQKKKKKKKSYITMYWFFINMFCIQRRPDT